MEVDETLLGAAGNGASNGRLYGWIPAHKVDKVASLPFVSRLESPINAVSDAGSVDTEGDALLRGASVRDRFAGFGINGSGIKVGVISTGVPNRGLVQATGDLPATITIDPVRSGRLTHDEGTAMLEIVHDIAPGANLFFSGFIHLGFHPSGEEIWQFTTDDMIDSINWMVGQGVDVIVDDLQFFNEPAFQDGPVANAVAAAVAQGVTFVSAAGNRADSHYQGNFNLSPNGFHDFSPGGAVDEVFDILVAPQQGVGAYLHWSDPWGASGNDYNLFIVDQFGFPLGDAGDDVQNGNDNPIEEATWRNPTNTVQRVFLVVQRVSGVDRELEIYLTSAAIAADDDATTSDSTFGHKAVESVMSVGAINAIDPGVDDVASYSSQGPSTIYTNFTSQTKTQRSPVDGAGIDHVQTRIGQLGFFSNPFRGTSAAAPHVAAIAALILDANPLLSPSAVSNVLRNTAVDIMAAGYDQVAGAGRFDALSAVYSVFTPGAVNLSPGSNSGSQTDLITNVRRPVFTGTAPAGSYVRLHVDGVVRGQVQLAAGVTNFSLAPNVDLSSGNRSIQVTVAENSSGPQSNLSSSLIVTIDFQLPGVTARTPAPGAILNAAIPNPVNIDVTFNEAVTGVDVSDLALTGAGNTVNSVSLLTGNTWRFVTTLQNGPVTVTLAPDAGDIRDIAGNNLLPVSWSFTVDRQAPTVISRTPAPGAILNAAIPNPVNIDVTFNEAVTGVDVSDLILTGAGVIPGTTSVTSVLNTTGNVWRFTVNALRDGAVNVSLAPDLGDIRDIAGNSLLAVSWSFTVDRQAPTVISRTPAPGAILNAAIPNPVNIDVTFSEAVVGVGASDLRLTGAGGTVHSVSSLGGNEWRFVATLFDGTVTATLPNTASGILDAAGNNLVSTSWSYTVDRQAPNAPTSLDLTAGSDTGRFNDDNITKDTSPTFTGNAEAGSTVQLFRAGSTEIGSGVADVNGNFTITTSLGHGVHSITAKATDPAGNQSAASTALTVNVDTFVAPPSPADMLNIDDTGIRNDDNITNHRQPRFIGTAEPDSSLVIYNEAPGLNPIFAFNGRADANGDYQMFAILDRPEGIWSLTVKATDLAGNESEGSPLVTVILDRTAPRVAGVTVHGPVGGASTYAVPAMGPGTDDQLHPVRLTNGLNRIDVEFDEDMGVNGGVRVVDEDAQVNHPISSVDATDPDLIKINLGTTLIKNRIWLELDDSWEDVAGNALDGDWNNPDTIGSAGYGGDAFPSGDGAAGADFAFKMNVYRGDTNDDGVIDLEDLNNVRNNFGGSGLGDGNWDGVVDLEDLNNVRNNFGFRVDLPWGSSPPAGGGALMGGGGPMLLTAGVTTSSTLAAPIGEEQLRAALYDEYHRRAADPSTTSPYDELFGWDVLGDDAWWDELLGAAV